MPLYLFARYDPKPGHQRELLNELSLVVEPTRAEPGCIRINVYESVREPQVFYIHSEWLDAAAFSAHAELPHTQRFMTNVVEHMTNPFQAVLTKQIV